MYLVLCKHLVQHLEMNLCLLCLPADEPWLAIASYLMPCNQDTLLHGSNYDSQLSKPALISVARIKLDGREKPGFQEIGE